MWWRKQESISILLLLCFAQWSHGMPGVEKEITELDDPYEYDSDSDPESDFTFLAPLSEVIKNHPYVEVKDKEQFEIPDSPVKDFWYGSEWPRRKAEKLFGSPPKKIKGNEERENKYYSTRWLYYKYPNEHPEAKKAIMAEEKARAEELRNLYDPANRISGDDELPDELVNELANESDNESDIEVEEVLPGNEQLQAKFEEDPRLPKDYAVIIDCGSSGSRVNIYQWGKGTVYPRFLPFITTMKDTVLRPISVKKRPGLSSLADAKVQEIHSYIDELADFITANIPKKRIPFTAVYVMATAGMRLLKQQKQDRIIKEVEDHLRRKYNFSKVSAAVITGAEEGLYRWTSVNAKGDRLFGEPARGAKTYSIIEMGGASVQVVHKNDNTKYVQEWAEDETKRHLMDTFAAGYMDAPLKAIENMRHNSMVHSITFLGFGGDSAREAYLDLLILKHFGHDTLKALARRIRRCLGLKCDHVQGEYQFDFLVVHDPCVPRGYDFWNLKKPTRMLESLYQTVGFIMDERDQGPGKTFTYGLIGSGDYILCRQLVQEMLQRAKSEKLNCVPGEPCMMDLIGEPWLPWVSDVIGLGDLYHTSDMIDNLIRGYNNDFVYFKTARLCNYHRVLLENFYDTFATSSISIVRDRVHGNCFRAIWMDVFLTDGLKMPENYPNYENRDMINDEAIDWTLGAVICKAKEIYKAIEKNRRKFQKIMERNKKSQLNQ